MICWMPLLWLLLCQSTAVHGVADAQEIIPHLYLGSCAAAHNVSFVKTHRIHTIVTVAPISECATPSVAAPSLTEYQVESARFDLLDDGFFQTALCFPFSPHARAGLHAIRPTLPALTELVWREESAGQNVLLHCKHGVSRSPAVALAYLMMKHHLSLRAAFTLVQEKRPQSVLRPQSAPF